MTRSVPLGSLVLWSLLNGCSSAAPRTPDDSAVIVDSGVAVDAAQAIDGGVAPADGATSLDVDGGLAACPTQGAGAILAPGACSVFTAAAAGASPTGDNATVDEYALGPAGTPQSLLVVLLNASLSTPSEFIVDPNTNLYNTLAAAGFHVLGVSYRSSNTIASLCATSDCFGATRDTIVTGAYVTGASNAVADIASDEGIVERLDAALRYLDAQQPASGWGQYLGTAGGTLAQRIAWDKVIASGHSQGGGHAAYIGKLYAVHRVVQLSSTCDALAGVPVAWTAAASGWATTPASSFVGFAAPTDFNAMGTPDGGDEICPYHYKVWQNMALAPANMHDDATTCGGNPHGATVACTANASRWAALYE